MNKKLIIIGLVICTLIAVFLHFYKINQVPPCLNADEAAFGYNAYSILKTGKDEYGKFLPLRFESFRDFKLPAYIYFSLPFIATFGLNIFSTRALNIMIGILFVPLVYFLTKELFKNKKVALLAAFLTSINPGIDILSRHAHEGVIGTFFILLTFLFFIKYLKTKSIYYFLIANLFLILNAFSYQTGRIYLVVFFFIELYFILKTKDLFDKKNLLKIFLLIFVVLFSFYFDFKYGLNRVDNLLFFKNIGFQLKINEYIGEEPIRLIHNKLTQSIIDVTNRYFAQISPQYLISSGDTNWRFGFPDLGLFTPIEYILFFVGLYYLFLKKESYRFLLLILLFITPFNNALTWQDPSLIRTYFMLFPIIIIIAYGFYFVCCEFKKNKYFKFTFFILLMMFLFFKFNSWNLYFFHYPKRAMTVRAWQCGYKELTDYVQQNYNKFDRFVITDRHGQPYIFFLFFLKYDPKKYQDQAIISSPDRFGFGQVDKFDKFIFKFHYDEKLKKTSFIGYPDEFNQLNIDKNKIKKIKIGTEEIFWIYENK